MKLSVVLEGCFGLNWNRWKYFVEAIEKMGFFGLYCTDHFYSLPPPYLESLDIVVALSYLASRSQKIIFGSLVSPVSIRDPIILARQAMALNELSKGRMILGIGAGWANVEHEMFGYKLGSIKIRMDRLEEGLEVISCLFKNNKPATFSGKYFQLNEALLFSHSEYVTPILIGGNGPRRTIPLAARYADIWNCRNLSPEEFLKLSNTLDKWIQFEERHPYDIKRTIMLPVICWSNEESLERQIEKLRENLPHFASMSTVDIIKFNFSSAGILGTPDKIIERLLSYAEAGVDELIFQWANLENIEGLELISKHVLPLF